MIKEIAEKWVADLRTPGLKQTKGVLFDGKGYCCLGRLCVVMGKEFEVVPSAFCPDDDQNFPSPQYFIEGENSVPPISVLSQVGLKTAIGEVFDDVKIHIDGISYEALTDANDNGATFPEIADWIEQNYEKL